MSASAGTADLLAIGAMVEALGRGLAAPAGLSVAGIDNVEFAADLAPSLTIIGIRATAIGRESAAQAVAGRSGDGRGAGVPISLVARYSTAGGHARTGCRSREPG
ncbi:substrate-binding domain-containing protein [Natronohydrobacter thiooxidans]|uniref:substrate-binding domain-containing protein n=1 Tax=Natronohydrobacter thiooxidans TaxID=87172 RepID=UPI003CCC2423